MFFSILIRLLLLQPSLAALHLFPSDQVKVWADKREDKVIGDSVSKDSKLILNC